MKPDVVLILLVNKLSINFCFERLIAIDLDPHFFPTFHRLFNIASKLIHSVPVIRIVQLTGVRLTGMEYTLFLTRLLVRLTRSPVNGSPVNEFRREVPVNLTVPLTGTECIMHIVRRHGPNCSQLWKRSYHNDVIVSKFDFEPVFDVTRFQKQKIRTSFRWNFSFPSERLEPLSTAAGRWGRSYHRRYDCCAGRQFDWRQLTFPSMKCRHFLYRQFHQHFTSSFCAHVLSSKTTKPNCN